MDYSLKDTTDNQLFFFSSSAGFCTADHMIDLYYRFTLRLFHDVAYKCTLFHRK